MDFKGLITCNHIVGDPEVKYTLQTCPRCLSTGYYGSIQAINDMEVVEGNTYLEQAIKKILKSKVDSSGYGFNYDLLTDVILPTTTNAIKQEIIRCLQFLINEQQTDKKRGVRYLSTEEIVLVDSVEVNVDSSDPRKVLVSVALYTKSGTPTKVTTDLRR